MILDITIQNVTCLRNRWYRSPVLSAIGCAVRSPCISLHHFSSLSHLSFRLQLVRFPKNGKTMGIPLKTAKERPERDSNPQSLPISVTGKQRLAIRPSGPTFGFITLLTHHGLLICFISLSSYQSGRSQKAKARRQASRDFLRFGCCVKTKSQGVRCISDDNEG